MALLVMNMEKNNTATTVSTGALRSRVGLILRPREEHRDIFDRGRAFWKLIASTITAHIGYNYPNTISAKSDYLNPKP